MKIGTRMNLKVLKRFSPFLGQIEWNSKAHPKPGQQVKKLLAKGWENRMKKLLAKGWENRLKKLLAKGWENRLKKFQSDVKFFIFQPEIVKKSDTVTSARK